MKTIHQQLSKTTEDVTGAFEANYFPREIAVYQQALRSTMALWEQLRLIQAEGPVEVTVRSHSTSVTLTVTSESGPAIVQDLHEQVARDAHRISGLLSRLHEDLDREGESAERIRLLNLLLTPVSSTGHALPDTSTLVSFLTDTPALGAKRRPAA